MENLNFASPFRDWDDGDYSIQQFRERASAVRKEMVCTQAINFLASMLMMVPLWYTGRYKNDLLFKLKNKSTYHICEI